MGKAPGKRTSVYFATDEEWAKYQELLQLLNDNSTSFSAWLEHVIDETLKSLKEEKNDLAR